MSDIFMSYQPLCGTLPDYILPTFLQREDLDKVCMQLDVIRYACSPDNAHQALKRLHYPADVQVHGDGTCSVDGVFSFRNLGYIVAKTLADITELLGDPATQRLLAWLRFHTNGRFAHVAVKPTKEELKVLYPDTPKVYCISGRERTGKDTLASLIGQGLECLYQTYKTYAFADILRQKFFKEVYNCSVPKDLDAYKDQHPLFRDELCKFADDYKVKHHPDIFTELVYGSMLQTLRQKQSVIISDCRFKTEWEAVKRLVKEAGLESRDIVAVRLSREGLEPARHVSQELFDIEPEYNPITYHAPAWDLLFLKSMRNVASKACAHVL